MFNRRRENNFTKAIRHIRNGLSYRQASTKFRIPLSTLHYRMTTPLKKPGKKYALSTKQENHIVQFLLRYAKRRIPLTLEHLREAISSVKATFSPDERMLLPFKKETTSDGYLRASRRRHGDQLKFGRPLMQEAKRFAAVNTETLTTHFATLEKLMSDYSLDEYRIFNLDEVGIFSGKDASGKLVCRRFLPRKGNQDFISANFGYEDRINMMPVISAAGLHSPPLFVIKGKRMTFRNKLVNGNVLTETPADCLPREAVIATRAEVGGVDSKNFLSWSQSFLRYTRDLRRGGQNILLVYDGYRSHLSLEVLTEFHNNNDVVYALPSHTSGKTQPLDSVLFSAFKGALNKTVHACMGNLDQHAIDIFDMCKIIRQAYETSFTNKNIRASFLRCWIWPLDVGRLLGEPRPASSAVDAPILDVDKLSDLFEKKRAATQSKKLGDDATIMDCGYVDTQNGCVMTADFFMTLIREKKGHDRNKKDLEEKRIEKELKAAKRHEKEIKDCARLRLAQNKRRGRAVGTSLESFLGSVRSMKERRAIAKMRTFKKQHGAWNDVEE